jgi:hypothetical protein
MLTQRLRPRRLLASHARRYIKVERDRLRKRQRHTEREIMVLNKPAHEIKRTMARSNSEVTSFYKGYICC